jgi:hypothetical protein
MGIWKKEYGGKFDAARHPHNLRRPDALRVRYSLERVL